MEGKFKLTEHNYRYLFENASDAMWVHDMAGNLIDVNTATERLTGFTRQELLNKNVKDFVTGKYLKLARDVRRELLDGKEINQPYDQRLVRKDGTIRALKLVTSLVTIDGEPKGFQHIARDVTEEKQMAEMLSRITDSSPIPTFVIDLQHRVTHWNTAIESLSGVSSERVLGTDRQWRSFYSRKRPTMADLIVDGASAEEIETYYQGKYKKSKLIDGAYEAEDFFTDLGKDGRWLHFTASPLTNQEGELVGALETLQDISEEKKLQQNMHYYVQLITRAQEEERKRLARDLHDDVSSSLLLLIQRLDATIPSNRTKQAQALRDKLHTWRSQAVEALEHVRRYAQDLRPRILDDLGLVPALEWMAEDLEKNHGIEAQVKIVGDERDLSAEVQLLLFRIAQEALSNIRRHARASDVTIRLKFGDDAIKMTVTDNGCGFAVPPRFEDLASTGRLGVMGMVERARLLRGTLNIKSEPGIGTKVITRLPYYPVELDYP
ncbi:MAG: PAS domain S-box protein [Chloroflexota bacterium]